MKKLFILLVGVMLTFGAMAQTRPNKALYINLGSGFGIANSYDNGSVPFFILGTSSIQNTGVSYAWKHYETDFEFSNVNSDLSNPAGILLNYDVNYDFLYRFRDSKSGRWHQWVGGSLDGFVDVRQIPDLQNASTNISLFGNLGAIWKAEYDFCFSKDKTHHWLTAFAKVNLPLLGVAYRPDFAFVGDGIGVTDPFEMLFAQHHSFAKFFPGCNTDLGLRLNFKNGKYAAISSYVTDKFP